ncbi:hypothetical protein AXF42_Ash000226 [Apostasia shenzhenica]|uniref:Uncharacterized protein n=1 Tax=Apostasia shenzhenica TaxID=1088818 RepID=A0A2I0AFS4_9ASPA|nr:hypothetical protein AXF42_Ash000226 [Apostasia shenzhenica]
MMILETVTESLHRIHNKNKDMDYACPTAKTGLFGGAAFLFLDASLIWVVCLLTRSSSAASQQIRRTIVSSMGTMGISLTSVVH